MKLKFLLFTLSLVATLPVFAQSIDEIRESSDYISGEGFGRSLREADNDALKSLISKISISVHSDFSSVEEEVVTSDGVDANSAVRSVIQTYSQATLQNTERIIVKQEPNAEVFRYVKRSDVNKIFESRKNKVLDMMSSAQKAESKGKIDDALRYYYWGYCLLQSLPNANSVTNEAGNVLVHWIPDQIDDILGGETLPAVVIGPWSDLIRYGETVPVAFPVQPFAIVRLSALLREDQPSGPGPGVGIDLDVNEEVIGAVAPVHCADLHALQSLELYLPCPDSFAPDHQLQRRLHPHPPARWLDALDPPLCDA